MGEEFEETNPLGETIRVIVLISLISLFQSKSIFIFQCIAKIDEDVLTIDAQGETKMAKRTFSFHETGIVMVKYY